MRVVQTFWSLPSRAFGLEGHTENRVCGGWTAERYHAMSWALSCHKWKQYYPDLHLYTDQQGAQWLCHELALPYKEVHLELEQVHNYPPLLWALPKLFVYAAQSEPFIHADGDVYIWSKLPRQLEQAPLFCQHIENDHSYYKNILDQIFRHFRFIPAELQISDWKQVRSINAGIIGGHDLAFFQEYTNLAFEFIHKNFSELAQVEQGPLNVVFEQLLFTRMAQERGKKVDVLFQEVDERFSEVLRFNTLPVLNVYAHAINFAKKSGHAYFQIEDRLRYEFPAVYRHIDAKYPAARPSVAVVQQPEQPDYFYCRQWMRQMKLFPGMAASLPDFIEDAVSENFEDPAFKLLLDIYQLEKYVQELRQINNDNLWDTRRTQYDSIYQKDLDLLTGRYTLDDQSCRIAWLHHDFDGKDLEQQLKDIVENKWQPALLETPKGLALYNSYGKVKFFFLADWALFLELFEEPGMTGYEFHDHLGSSSKISYQGNDLKEKVQEFLITHLIDPWCLKISVNKAITPSMPAESQVH